MLLPVKRGGCSLTFVILLLLPVSHALRSMVIIEPEYRGDGVTREAVFALSYYFSATIVGNNDVPEKCDLKQCDCLKKYLPDLKLNTVVYISDGQKCLSTDVEGVYEVVIVDSVPTLKNGTGHILSGWQPIAAYIAKTAPIIDYKMMTATKPDKEGITLPVWALVILIIVLVAAVLAALGLCIWNKLNGNKKFSLKNLSNSLSGSPTKSSGKKSKSAKTTKSSKSGGSSKSSKSKKAKSGSAKSMKKSSESNSRESSKGSRSETEKSSKGKLKGRKATSKDKLKTVKPTPGKKMPKDTRISEISEGSQRNNSSDRSELHSMRSDIVADPPPPVVLPKRSPESVLNEPVNSAEFQHYLSILGKVCVDYHDDPEMYSVTPDGKPGFLYSTMSKVAPEKPEEFAVICKDLKTTIMSGMAHWQHPRFHAYFPAGRSYPDTLADLMGACFGCVGFSWDSCPALTELENAMMNWMGRAFGLSEEFLFQECPEKSQGGGTMHESASDAVFNAVLAGRQKKIKELAAKEVGTVTKDGVSYDLEVIHEHARKLVAYTSKDAHSCIEKACKLALMRCRSIQALEENGWGLTGEQIEREIKKDIEKGLVPCHIHVTLGTTSTASSDHLNTIWPIAQKYNMWLHVDAAYAGNCWIDPQHRINCAGLEHATSLNINAHKFLLHSVPCSLFWTRDQKSYKDAFAITPVYLKPAHENATDLRDWAVQLSRKFKALKTWLVVRMYGIEGLKHYVNHIISLSIYFEKLIASHPNLRIFGKRNFSLFCIQYHEPGMTPAEINEATQKFCQYMNASHQIFFTHTKVADNNLIRVSVNYEKSTRSTIEGSWTIVQNLLDEFKTKRLTESMANLPAGSPLPGRTRALLPGDMDYDVCGSANAITDVTAFNTSSSAHSPRAPQSPSSCSTANQTKQ